MSCRVPPPRRSLGFSLIELLVSVAIGLVVTLAVSTLLINSEGSKRSVGALNDTNQTGAYIAYIVDRTLRSAGSGFVQARQDAFGCELHASQAGADLLPRAAGNDFPEPFAALSGQPVRLAPVVISKNASKTGSDVLTVMTGASGRSEAGLRVTSAETNDTLILPTTLNVRPNDLLLLTQGANPCMLQQVGAAFTNTPSLDVPVGLGGDYHAATIDGLPVTTYGNGTASAYLLGNSAAGRPQFSLIGVGDNNTLFSYDLLQTDGATTSVPLADGVVLLRALYGLDTNDDGVLDTWADPDPADAAKYDAATLLDGSGTSLLKLQRIVAIRVGLVMRTSLLEKSDVAPDSLTLFGDLGGDFEEAHSIATADRRYRHRAIEVTVPLRNLLP